MESPKWAVAPGCDRFCARTLDRLSAKLFGKTREEAPQISCVRIIPQLSHYKTNYCALLKLIASESLPHFNSYLVDYIRTCRVFPFRRIDPEFLSVKMRFLRKIKNKNSRDKLRNGTFGRNLQTKPINEKIIG